MTTDRTTAAVTARKCWRTLEPYHGMIYFVPEAEAAYSELGVTGRSGYFGSRSAAMGAVGARVVQATFFNFEPGLVDHAMDGVWDQTTPDDLLLARHNAVDAALQRMLGDALEDPAIETAVDLLRPAVETACDHPEGRPLFAGHARLPEPEMPHLALWWAVTLLREFRGDGHIAALVDAELRGLDALILHGATGDVPMAVLQQTRAWSDDQWAAGLEDMASRGLVDPETETLTDAGRLLREHIEERTDHLAAIAWRVLDPDAADRLRSLVRPHSKSISAATFA